MSAQMKPQGPIGARVRSGSLLFFGLLAACANSIQDLGVEAIQPKDVVVPNGLRLRTEQVQSHSRQAGNWRYADLYYTGQTKVAAACAHLLDRMPQHRWQLVEDSQPAEGQRNLTFVRGPYTADYQLKRVDGVTRMTVEIRTENSDQ